MSDEISAHVVLEQCLQRASLNGARLTQDSPILPDVWIAYGLHGSTTVDTRRNARPIVQDLLLSSHWESNAIELACTLHARLAGGPRRADGGDAASEARIACTQGTVAAHLTFDELVWAALPLSNWWHQYLLAPHADEDPDLLAQWRDRAKQPRLAASILAGLRRLYGDPEPPAVAGAEPVPRATEDLIWLVEVAGTLKRLLTRAPGGLLTISTSSESMLASELQRIRGSHDQVLAAFFSIFADVRGENPACKFLWGVNRNRRGTLAMYHSTATVKADAARQLFGVRGARVRWAVVDSGIDGSHLAFRKRDNDGNLKPGTRILDVFDFTRVRDVLSEDFPDIIAAYEKARAAQAAQAGDDGEDDAADPRVALHGIDWAHWEERLRMPMKQRAEPPENGHGTHVAGILAADWRPGDDEYDKLGPPSALSLPGEQVRTGICPELGLYDIRVVDADGVCTEFALVAALQFIRAFNARHDHLEIMGVNLSLSLFHKVANYACGRTPVCEECEQLVASGVVVVAAAGNDGRARYLTERGKLDEGYRSMSITDPGNAAAVITVGATHRSDPHKYGVSFFSSRGPTGDGRAKPDLVAPGEKVVSTLPGNSEGAMDGTSMAAPHVSGAAALILARHPEFIGRPAEIKQILCSTAVDLGRERYFQGAGMLDILAALESI